MNTCTVSRSLANASQVGEGEPLILLFAADPLASIVSQELRATVTPRVAVAETQLLCLEALRREPVDLLLLEESLACLNPMTAQTLYEAARATVIVEVNFGLMQAERVALSARAALQRRKLDLMQARVAAKAALQNELIGSLTGLLLEAQLALRQAGPGLAPALERLVDLAEHVSAQLRADD